MAAAGGNTPTDSSAGSVADPLEPPTKPPPQDETLFTTWTTEHIEELSKRIITDQCNAGVFDSPATQHMIPTFRATHDGLPSAYSRDEYMNNMKGHVQAMPDMRLEILNASSEVDEGRGRATVYVWMKLTNLLHDMERESVVALQWARRQGDWYCVKYTGMRGPAGFA